MARDRKPHIAFFGRRNNGKSTLINCLTQQDIAIVSPIAGTTTDPVKKSMEIAGVGPAILIDTAGIDDTGELGEKRVTKSLRILDQIDLAILIVTNNQLENWEFDLAEKFTQRGVPFIVVHNKKDIEPASQKTKNSYKEIGAKFFLEFSAGEDTVEINNCIRNAIPETAWSNPTLLGDIIAPKDIVMLITPIDTEAPEGRMILPQVQTIRDVLDNHAINIVLKESEVEHFLRTTGVKPKLAVTDSQLFGKIDKIIPNEILLTGFSILLARFRGDFEAYKKGTPYLDKLRDGDKVLILESCTHHSTCDDIGRVKIPRWLKNHIKGEIHFDIVAGLDNIPQPINQYAIVIQCGGCMITRRQLQNRLRPAIEADIPVTNYGMAIAWMKGIYNRAMQPFNL
ncbi:[FeFe] hydrogenase H-cluster maturation GTPase HydF [Natronoflexus pectinivorans]|uniref:[FeFe] hydrogenase H-cluster maturation GTPase HydF n=1 Tax=Natronoflexus pectinivorans TaxID=682526 RepID=A0A4V2RWW6_9BACT|nr:[FeFe] hydrogenase H-cluster maturation GTPase HydF [Natronoflexus pectinivorans]TCO10491.1 [FeFe] hydrogenase H-cluster maturation GTPase HydF [Natronoflexus pectinivorans]